MPQSLHILAAHIIFSTKGRRPWLAAGIRERIWAYQSRILQNLECNSITIGGIADHVHVLCNLTKKFSTVKVLEILKKDSSKFVKTLDSSLGEFHWQDGYGLFSVSPSHFEAIRKYILYQDEHPQKGNVSGGVSAHPKKIWRAVRRTIFVGLRFFGMPFQGELISMGIFRPRALPSATVFTRLRRAKEDCGDLSRKSIGNLHAAVDAVLQSF